MRDQGTDLEFFDEGVTQGALLATPQGRAITAAGVGSKKIAR